MQKSQALKKGFTLIELLIVIAILAILGSAVVVVLNPAEILAQTRDGTRISDLNTLRNAINTYLVNTTESPLNLGTCTGVGRGTAAGTTPFVIGTGTVVVPANPTLITNAGWIDVTFTSVSGGSPISALPLDPTNSTTYFYAYMCAESISTGYVFELNAKMESTKFAGKMANAVDGGNNASWYEMGTDPGLDL